MGIVLYKLTTGLHPFMGENDLVTMRNIISRPLLPPRVKNPGFPQEVEQVLVKCLQKDPDKRFQTMAELGQAVERALATMGVADDDLGSYVRGIMGDRGAKRRAAVRDAVRVADERYATGTHAAVTIPLTQTTHEHISEVVLTQMKSSVMDEPVSSRAIPDAGPSSVSHSGLTGSSSVTGTPSTHTPPPPSASSWPGGDAQPHDPHSGSHQAVIVAAGVPRRGRWSGVLVGLAGAVAALVIGVVAVRSGRPAVKASGSRGARPAATAAVTVNATPTAAPTTSVTASVTASATVTAAAPVPTDVSPASTASVAAVVPTATVERPRTPFRGTAPTAKPTAEADSPPHNLGNGKVPIYTNPGF